VIPERTPENRKIASLTPVLTTLTYDALNRLKAKTYNDNLQTPRVDYYYDSAGLGFAQKVLLLICGFAAFRAESLRLSVSELKS